MKTKPVQFFLDEARHRELKTALAKAGKTMQDFFTDLVEEYLRGKDND